MTKYGAILADPPWQFNSLWGGRPKKIGGNYPSRAIEAHYETMRTSDICALPIADMAAEDCVLFLWGCWPRMPDAIQVIDAWGFTYKTCAFCWVKGRSLPLFPDDFHDKMGLGYWTRANSEFCLLATRGKPKRLATDVRQVIKAPLRQHSRKPDDQYERIQRLVDGPYLELFARQKWPGWDSWGNETDKFCADINAQEEKE